MARTAASVLRQSALARAAAREKLRDEFAGQAMQGMLIAGAADLAEGTWDRFLSEAAPKAYAVADALLRARQEPE